MEINASGGYEKRTWSTCYQKYHSLIPQVSIDFPSHASKLWFNVLKQTFSVSANILQLFLSPHLKKPYGWQGAAANIIAAHSPQNFRLPYLMSLEDNKELRMLPTEYQLGGVFSLFREKNKSALHSQVKMQLGIASC